MAEIEQHRRSIRSYVQRNSRITRAQQQAIDNHWSEFGLDYQATPLNLSAVFQRSVCKVLDIGAGMGDSTLQLAKQYPDRDFLAVEVHLPGVGSIIHNAKKLALNNIRVIQRDIHDVLDHQLPQQSIDIAYIFFPDPWHKKRHHKRRLINQDFLDKLTHVMKPQGRIYIATDWHDYAEQIIAITQRVDGLQNISGASQILPRPAWRPYTKFEKRGLNLEHRVWDLAFSLTGS